LYYLKKTDSLRNTCMKKYLIIVFLIVCFGNWAYSQNKRLFTVDEFIQLIKQYHPVAKQANLQTQFADAELLAAKGAFDPTIAIGADRKTFDGSNYYFHTNPELKIPTPIGIDVKTGIENNGGNNLANEISSGKTSYAGVEVALVKGLLIDQRRAALQQAKIFKNQSEQERLRILNDILFDAYTSYWQWAGAYQLYSIYNQFLNISTDRLRLVKIAYQNGDRAWADSIEAFTQVQNFEILQADASIKLNAAVYNLSNYLWLKNDSAYLLPEQFLPDTIAFAINNFNPSLNDLVTKAQNENPIISSYNFKLDALEVERKLKFQSLLPVLNFKYNLLNKDYYVLKGFNAALLENNYKWGIDFKLPLFLREGRGEYKKAKLKITETNLQLNAKRWEVENKIRTYFTEANLLQQQLSIINSAYNNYNTLLKTEVLKFKNGESSLFVINSRENKLIETLQKQIELRIKYFKAVYAVEWAAGLLR
jgi:outer membrane protein TolC